MALAVVFVGGASLTGQTSWSQQPGLPTGTFVQSGTYDAGRDRVVCYFQGNNWEFDGANWQAYQTTPSPPFGGLMAYDESRGVIVMHTNYNNVLETWERNGNNWSLANTGTPAFESITFHRGRGHVMGFGGGTNFVVPGNDLYEWDGVSWTLVPANNAPPRFVMPTVQVGYGNIAHDWRRDKLCIFGAGYITGGTLTRLAETWEWDAGSGWVQRSAGGPTTGAEAFFDTQRGVQTIITQTSSGQFQPWEWDGVGQWTQVTGVLGPLPTSSPMTPLVFDTKRGRALKMFVDDSLWAFGSTNPARYEPQGAGCTAGAPGSDLVLTSPWTRAWVGSATTPGYSLSLDATNLPHSAAVLAVGFSDQSYGATPLPVDLAAYGMPGCFGRVAPDATRLLVGAGGIANFQLPIPRTAGLIGQPFYVQAFVPALNANVAGMLTTPSYRGTVGFLR
jgi:hypothetical protein